MSYRIKVVVGARPNFVKAAPLVHALSAIDGVEIDLLHTGQHYDRSLSDGFMDQLDLPTPAHYLGVGSGTQAEQTAAILVGVERVLGESRPDAIVVVGDVNSTMGAALAAAKLGVPVVHLESGLRSRDWSMPEEVNRAVTDRVADLLLCHCQEAVDNLAREGIPAERIGLVGNTMIDSLFRLLPSARAGGAVARLGLISRGYVLVTLHRPALVDDPDRLSKVLRVLYDLADEIPVVFPMHPRTRARLERDGGHTRDEVRFLDPLDYLDFIALEADARLVVTDSGGVQEETSVLGTACLTYRDTTERAITVELGTNRLIGVDPAALAVACREEIAGVPSSVPPSIPLWDGNAGQRAAQVIMRFLDART